MGGWAVLIIILIIIVIVASVFASPFGIFFSDEVKEENCIPISSIVAECNTEFSKKLNDIEDSKIYDRVVYEGEQAKWEEVISIFSVKIAGSDDKTAQDVVIIDESKKQKLKKVFWDMNSISSHIENGEETVLYITINPKTKEEMCKKYAFTDKQKEALDTLLENRNILISLSKSLDISDSTAKEILDNLSDDLTENRKEVVKAACSLVGKVNYFWGGKSSKIGWDSNWGKMTLVTAEGSPSTGKMRPFGLDCSGYVTWCFINSGFSASDIGHGTRGQISKCTRISWSYSQPGDLVFLEDLSHVGIIVGKDSGGNILVAHASSGANNVVISSATAFDFVVRPNCY